MTRQPLIWVLTDDRAGNAAQAVGVAEALGRPFITKEIRYTPLAHLPNAITGARLIGLTVESRMGLLPPWPDVVISAGRRTAPVARWIKRIGATAHGMRVILAHLMYPGSRGAGEFDLLVVPHHDALAPENAGENIMRVTGAPHRLTPARLTSAANIWAGRVAGLPRPLVALIAGGATHRKPFPASLATDLGHQVSELAARIGGGVLLATSRRTGRKAELALVKAVTVPSRAFLWGEGGDNPYFGFLALADAIVVTGDSVSMCSEACAAPGAVYIYAPDGMATPKHARLHRELYDLGLARPFDGTFAPGPHAPLNAANDIARAIDDLIRNRFTG